MSNDDLTVVTVDGVTIEVTQGNIVNQNDFDAIVNATNAELRTGGGVAGAIHDAAGPALAEEARPMAPIRVGAAVITSGHRLPNRWVIHTLGPVYGKDQPEDQYLTDCYRHSLEVAEENGVESIAFPAVSTGAFGYPVGSAAEIALATVMEKAPSLESVRRIRFVLYGEDSYRAHKETLERLASARAD